MFTSRLGKNIAKVAIAGGLASTALVGVSSQAFASGTSGTTLGCYSTWGSTGSNAHCTNPYATQSGSYENQGSCYYSSDQYSGWTYMAAGSYVDGWGQVDCTFSINWSQVLF